MFVFCFHEIMSSFPPIFEYRYSKKQLLQNEPNVKFFQKRLLHSLLTTSTVIFFSFSGSPPVDVHTLIDFIFFFKMIEFFVLKKLHI